MANDIKLQSKNGFPIDKNLRPLKVGGETTSIEISSHRGAGCRITGDLEVVGGDIKGNIKDMVLEDVTLDSLTTNSIISTDLTIDDSGDITLDPDGDLIISGADTKIDATKKLYFDGGGDTYISESSADTLLFRCGNDIPFVLTEGGTSGNFAIFKDACAGFTKGTATFSTSGVIGDGNDSTDVDFRFTNKMELTLTDNISGSSEFINMIFPEVSGNFLLVLIQDGTGSRTVASAGWVAYASDETACDNTAGADGTDGAVRWAGGSAPTLTTTANKSDIISIYWDAITQTAFAVASLNF